MTDLRKAAKMAFDLLCDAVEPTATQVQADIGMCAQWDVDAIECIEILRQALAQPEQNSEAYGYAKRLAECIWEKHYKEESPHWRPSDNTFSVLTQIDNMTCGLEKAQPEQEKLCVVCGKPTMHMGNKCYGCCQTAQPEQEPSLWVKQGEKLQAGFTKEWIKLQEQQDSPPKREWVGLTDEEIDECNKLGLRNDVYKAIEAKLKEKNA